MGMFEFENNEEMVEMVTLLEGWRSIFNLLMAETFDPNTPAEARYSTNFLE